MQLHHEGNPEILKHVSGGRLAACCICAYLIGTCLVMPKLLVPVWCWTEDADLC